MATAHVFLGIICFSAAGSFGQFDRHLLSKDRLRTKVTEVAATQIGVREKTGHNDGKEVELYLCYTGLKKGNPWCAAYVSWVFGQAGLKHPCTAWSPDMFPPDHVLKDKSGVVKADLFGIYFPNLGRIGHVGIVTGAIGHWVKTAEGNTNVAGSREGDGVYAKLRHVKTIRCFADWIGKGIKK